MSSKTLFSMKKAVDLLRRNTKQGYVVLRHHSVMGPDGVVRSPYKNIEIPNMTVYDYVWQNLEKWPERTATVCATTGRGYTYEQCFALSNTFAANLRKKFSVRDGDTVAVMLPNVPDYPLIVMGVLEAGGLVTTVNPMYTAYEVQRQLHSSAAKVIVTLPEAVKTVKEALRLLKTTIPIIVIKTNRDPLPEGTVCFNEITEDPHVDKSCLKEVRRDDPNDVCILPYSSGTSGLPKGVELTNRNIVANCEQICEEHVRCHADTTSTHQDSVMTVLPLFHIYALSVIMFHKLANGIKLVTLPKFAPEPFIRAMEKHRTNVVFVAPPLVLLMASHPAATSESLQYIETVINGAAPLASTDADRLFKNLKRKIDFRQGYGLTETSPVVSMTPRGLENYACVGYALPNTEMKIVDSNLKTLGLNEKGELLVKGPQVMKGYKDNAQANKETFTEDGWFRTGDLAVIDNDGILTIADRLKELIKVKGFQVPPAELEAIIRDHPDVSDAAVVGVPHEKNGEAPRAFVVVKKGSKVDAQGIKDFVKEKVAPYKRVDDVTFIDVVPKSSSGKILRRELKEKYC